MWQGGVPSLHGVNGEGEGTYGREEGTCGSRDDDEPVIGIELLVLEESSRFTLVVHDNGVGLPEDIDIHTAETLGMQLISMLVQQLKGTIEIDRKNGTEFRIGFTVRDVSTLRNHGSTP